jgi:hypothetical protein
MSYATDELHRRRFLERAGGLLAGLGGTLLLSGCGGGSAAGETGAVPVVSAPVTVVPAPTPTPPPTSNAPTDATALNFALNLAYLGAQFYGYGAGGAGIAASLVTGVGRQGSVVGGRQVAFADDGAARFATELAADKLTHVTGLRGLLGTAAAAQPGLDFSANASAAFSTVARTAGIVSSGATFDAFAGDDNFLLGALFIEDVVAAAYRSLLPSVTTDTSAQLITANLADAIYHGSMVRTMLADRAAENPALTSSLAAACASLARLDGTAVGDQSLAADGTSANLVDADGNAIPFLRSATQVLKVFYVAPDTVQIGGFLPYGINAVQIA